MQKSDLKTISESEAIWKRGTQDERMYVRDSEIVCLPLKIENVGNGIATRLCVGLYKVGGKPHYETEITLKQNEKRKLFIFSREQFDDIKGQYILSVKYSDIAGNRYEQAFPIELTIGEKGRRLKSIDLTGTQNMIGRDSSHVNV